MTIFMTILESLPYIISFAAAVAAVTKTPRDDEMVGKAKKAHGIAMKVINVLALNIGRAKNK